MKTQPVMITITTALALLGATALRGQESSPTTAPAAGSSGGRPAGQSGDANAGAITTAAPQAQRTRQTESSRRTANEAPRAVAVTETPAGSIYDARTDSYILKSADGSKLEVLAGRSWGSPAGEGDRMLVIRSSEADPKAQANLEEDMAVMSRVLDNALEQKFGDERQRRTMGIRLLFTPSQSPMRSLYLEGYGALFMVNVGFPLLPPPAKAEPQKEEPRTDSAWEDARRELYGTPSPFETVGGPAAGPGEEYSQSKVDNLKDTLLDALKEATNVRDLKPDDWVTVCVFGGPGERGTGTSAARTPVKPRTLGSSGTASGSVATVPVLGDVPMTGRLFRSDSARGSTHGTVMTIRVKKSDADALAKGKLTPDEFRKKARIVTYAGPVGAGYRVATF